MKVRVPLFFVRSSSVVPIQESFESLTTWLIAQWCGPFPQSAVSCTPSPASLSTDGKPFGGWDRSSNQYAPCNKRPISWLQCTQICARWVRLYLILWLVSFSLLCPKVNDFLCFHQSDVNRPEKRIWMLPSSLAYAVLFKNAEHRKMPIVSHFSFSLDCWPKYSNLSYRFSTRISQTSILKWDLPLPFLFAFLLLCGQSVTWRRAVILLFSSLISIFQLALPPHDIFFRRDASMPKTFFFIITTVGWSTWL